MDKTQSSGLIGQRQERIEKANKLRELGINPYPSRSNRTNLAKEVVDGYEEFEGKTVSVAGRLMSLRTHGQLAFADLQDSSGQIQIYIRNDEINGTSSESQTIGFDDLNLVDRGDLISVEGVVTKTQTGQISILAKNFRIIAKSIRPLPDKWEGIKDKEILNRQRYLDTIMNPEKRWRFEKAAQITFAIREYLNSKGFLEIKTPILQPLYGGGMAKPFKTHVNALDVDYYMAISHELYLKRLIVAGFENVYNMVGYFRNEGIDRSHNPEFSMLETMTAYQNYEYNMDLIEGMYKYIGEKVFGKTTFNIQGQEIDFGKPWKRIMMVDAVKEETGVDFRNINSVSEARDVLKKHGVQELPGTVGDCLKEIFEAKVEEKLIQPTFVYGHPVEISPLAKVMDSDPRYVERFEVFIGGIEGGDNWTELNDPIELYERFKDQFERGRGGDDEAHPMDIEFLEAMEYGMPPTTGLGPGIERLTMMFTETDYIDDVMFFPMMKPAPYTEQQKEIYGAEFLGEMKPSNTTSKNLGNLDIDTHKVKISDEVLAKYPGLKLGYMIVEDVKVKKSDAELRQLMSEVTKSVASKFTSKSEVREYPSIAGFRDIYKSFGADPSSTMNSAEALIQRAVSGKDLYNVNNVVDTYNSTCMETGLPMAAYDLDSIQGEVVLRFAEEGETIHRIGEDEPTEVKTGTLAYADDEGITCMNLNYRDADRTKVTEKTRNLLVFVDGNENVSEEEIMNALTILRDRLEKYTGGRAKSYAIFPQNNINKKEIMAESTMQQPSPSLEKAEELMLENVQDPYQRYHAYMISYCMQEYAKLLGEEDQAERWAVCGMVHDWDYDFDPEGHPENNVDKLRDKDYPEDIIQAILGHKPELNEPRNTKMAQALIAVDEMAGLLFAYSRLKGGYDDMKAKSIKKKFKDKSFAAKINRDDIMLGVNELGLTIEEHIENMVNIVKGFDRAYE